MYGKTSLSNLREIIWFVGRFVSPVECFFIISAFLLFRKLVLLENEKGSEILKKYIFHLMSDYKLKTNIHPYGIGTGVRITRTIVRVQFRIPKFKLRECQFPSHKYGHSSGMSLLSLL